MDSFEEFDHTGSPLPLATNTATGDLRAGRKNDCSRCAALDAGSQAAKVTLIDRRNLLSHAQYLGLLYPERLSRLRIARD
jgi:hypothetical protein